MNKTTDDISKAQPPADKKAQDIQEQIDRTRSDLGETLEAIEHKLNPSVLREKALEEIQVVEDRVKVAVKEQLEEAKEKLKVELTEAKETAKREVVNALEHAKTAVRAATIGKVETMARRANEATVEARDSILETLWQNPLPTALAGVGLVWLYMNRRSETREPSYYGDSEWRRPGAGGAGHGLQQATSRAAHEVSRHASDMAHAAGEAVSQASDTAGRVAHDAADAAGQLAHDAADAAGRVAHQVSEGASHLAHGATEMGTRAIGTARDQAKRVDRSFHEALHSNPMAVGTAFLAAGAVVGMALPRTRREDALMGATRDELLGKARDAAQEAVGSAKELAHQGIREAKSALGPGQ